MATTPAHVGRWRRRRDARPGEIIQAALALFVERGFAATRVEEIAARAGVTKGTVYLYFDSKEDLFRAAVEESLVPLIETGERMVEEAGPSQAELFRVLVAGWWDLMREPPLSGLPKLMMAEAANFPEVTRFYAEQVAKRSRRMFERVLERGMERGEFRAMNVSNAVRLALAPLNWALTYGHSLACYDPSFDLESFVEDHIDVFLRGIARDPEKVCRHA
ncbi:MAG: TetR/AcrR family transcriptional regulator [Gemmatimonadetes bacterium]|nr:TetR/AcrR family transcriptional regulator [Gemmatimonadota bacterium]